MLKSRNLSILAVTCLWGWAVVLAAQEADGAKETPARSRQDSQAEAVPITPDQEATALAFAREHHPELGDLLAPLKNMDQGRYEQAIQELFRTSEQLAKLQTRTPERYATELELWKLDSRVRLLVAQAGVGPPAKIKDQIRELLMQRNEVRLQQLGEERARIAARLEKLDQSMQQLRDNSIAATDKEVERLLKSAKSSRPKPSRAVESKSRPAPVKP